MHAPPFGVALLHPAEDHAESDAGLAVAVVAELVKRGVITEDQVFTHPMRNQITRCLGDAPTVKVDTQPLMLQAGDRLLLCSDGLWEMVRDWRIATIVTTLMPTPSDTAHALIQAALAGGGEDNVSAIVAQVSNV